MMSFSSAPWTSSMTMNGTGADGAVRRHLAVFAGVVDADDGRVRHAGRRLRLEAEARAERVVVREVAPEHLDRHDPAEGQVVAPVDARHAASTDGLIDAIAPRKHARLSCHGHSLGGTESA